MARQRRIRTVLEARKRSSSATRVTKSARDPYMRTPPLPEDELARLAALHCLGLLDSPAEERFDRITRLTQRLFGVPIALISLVDRDRQWFKSRQGLAAEQTSREISFGCGSSRSTWLTTYFTSRSAGFRRDGGVGGSAAGTAAPS